MSRVQKLDELIPDRKNANKGTQYGLKLLDDSLRKYGAGRSILVDKHGVIIAGNKTAERAMDLKIEDVIVVKTDGTQLVAVQRTDLDLETDEQARKLAYADNKVGEVDLEWDADALFNDIEAGLDLSDMFTDNELIDIIGERMNGGTPDDVEPQIDRAEALRERWGVRSGQLWQLGEHRLICGDCTDEAVVARLMDGESADMIFTDPPYNVASESRNYAADRSKAMNDLKNAEWDKDFDIGELFPILENVMSENCAVYVCTSQWLVQQIWKWMWKWSDFCSYVIWCKPNPMPSLSMRHWTWATEIIPYAVRGKHISNFPKGEHALNWWNIAKSKETEHPTEKQIEVPERAIRFSSNEGMVVFDGFLGSGTTLIACERLNRKCRAIEVSAGYTAVAIQRWVDVTGGTPVILENTGGN